MGTDIVDALLRCASVVKVLVGSLEYNFETHGFPQSARSLIESCQSPATPTPTPRPTLTPFTTEPLTTPIAFPTFPPPALQVVPEGQLLEFAAACGSLMDADIGPSRL